MHINEQIDKIFGDINHNNKRKYHSPEAILKQTKNNILRENKKLIKKNSHNSFHSNSNHSMYAIDNNKEKKNFYLKNEEDSSFYVEFMKKIKEDEKELENNYKLVNRRSKHFQMKPYIIKKEKSQGNIHSKHFLEGGKELAILKNNYSLINEDKNEENYETFKIQKIKKKKNSNFNESIIINNQKNTKVIVNNNMNHFQSQNTNLHYEKNNQNTINSKRCFNLEEEKVQKSIQFEIINKFRYFNGLKVQNALSFGQLIKDANFSNVKKLNLNNHENDYNKSTENINQHEIIYPSSNNLLKIKKNPIFCCF